MNALELADQLTAEWNGEGFQPDTSKDAAAMLRKQDAAIRQLRESITTSMASSQWPHVSFMIRARIEAALAATENLK